MRMADDIYGHPLCEIVCLAAGREEECSAEQAAALIAEEYGIARKDALETIDCAKKAGYVRLDGDGDGRIFPTWKGLRFYEMMRG